MNGDPSTALDGLDARIGDWMHTREPEGSSPEIVAAVMTRVSATAQRPAMLVRPLGRRRALPRTSMLVPALAIFVAVVLAAGAVIAGARLLLDRQSPPNEGAVTNGPIVLVINGKAVSIKDGRTRATVNVPVGAMSCPTFSPDGRYLGYIATSPDGGLKSLVAAAPDGSDPHELWSGTFSDQIFHQLLWSGDGSRVAANGGITGGGTDEQFWTVVGDVRTDSAQLIESIGLEFPGEAWWNGADNTQLAFNSGGGTLLQVIDTDDGSVREIDRGGWMHAVAWSPDGRTIAYTAQSAQSASDGSLKFVDPDGSNDRSVSAGRAGDFGLLAWSPDGSHLAVRVDGTGPDGTFQMALFDPSGTAENVLGPFPVSANFSFTWSPDSRELLLGLGGSGIGRGTSGPLVVPIDGGAPRSIGVAPGEAYIQCPPSWQPIVQ